MVDQKTIDIKIDEIAKLARLKITPDEGVFYSQQLSKVLSHFNQISKINTDHIEPLVTPSEIEFYARPDQVESLFTAEQMVANAPEKAGHLFKVPPVV
ncbi:MAG: Asp-tRNA(Asn)/Glu-tRNA(Gln) amidotransferase subunit GatC [Pseudobdellovibrio sp.]